LLAFTPDSGLQPKAAGLLHLLAFTLRAAVGLGRVTRSEALRITAVPSCARAARSPLSSPLRSVQSVQLVRCFQNLVRVDGRIYVRPNARDVAGSVHQK
jgi:hypothetical protein